MGFAHSLVFILHTLPAFADGLRIHVASGQLCRDPQGELFPDGDCCPNYFRCSRGQWLGLSCKPEEVFDTATQSCNHRRHVSSCTDFPFCQECVKNSVNFYISEKKYDFSTSRICDDVYPRAVMRNRFDICSALHLVEGCSLCGGLISEKFWIGFSVDGGRVTENLTEFLGVPLEFPFGSNFGKCVALEVKYSGSPGVIAKWIYTSCSKHLRTLCARSQKNTNEEFLADGTNDIFKIASKPGFSDPRIPECDFDTVLYDDVLEVEEKIQENAGIQNRSCEIRDPEGLLWIVLLTAFLCEENEVELNYFRAACPVIFDESDGNLTYAIGEVYEDREIFAGYLEDPVLDYDDNKRITKVAAPENFLLSISVIKGQNQTIQPAEVVFYYQLNASLVLEKNAFNLTYENGDDRIVGSTSRVTGYNPQCVFLDENGKFSSYGCRCEMVGKQAKCTANHTTVFAVLLAVDSITMSHETKVLSIVAQSVSVCFLVVALIILMRVRKKVRGERIVIQINLVISLTFLHFWTLLHDVALHFPALCRAVAVMTQFFLLSSAFWMTNEALLLLLKTSKWAFTHTKRRKVAIATMIFGWGTAAVVSSITAAVGFSTGTYMKRNLLHDVTQNNSHKNTPQYDFCWLNPDSGIRWAAIGPVVFLLLVNTVVAVKVAVFVYGKRQDSTNLKPVEGPSRDKGHLDCLSVAFKAFIILMPALGIPWLLMLFANVNDLTTRVAFLHASIVLNGLQGVSVFIVYCVVSEEVRCAFIKSLTALSDTWQSITDSLDRRRKRNASPAVSGSRDHETAF